MAELFTVHQKGKGGAEFVHCQAVVVEDAEGLVLRFL